MSRRRSIQDQNSGWFSRVALVGTLWRSFELLSLIMACGTYLKVFWSVLLIFSLLPGGEAVPRPDVHPSVVHDSGRPASFQSKAPSGNLSPSQDPSTSEYSEVLANASGSYQTKNASRSDEPPSHRTISNGPWRVLPFFSHSSVVTPSQNGSLLDQVADKRAAFNQSLRASPVPGAVSLLGYDSTQANFTPVQNALHPFNQGYGKIWLPVGHGPLRPPAQGVDFAQSSYASKQKFGPQGVSAPGHLLVPPVGSSPAQMPSSQGEYLYSHVSLVPDLGMTHNAGLVPSQSHRPQVGSSSPYGFYPSRFPTGQDGISPPIHSSASGITGIVPHVAYQGGAISSQAVGPVSRSVPVLQMASPVWALSAHDSYPDEFTVPAYMSSYFLSQPSNAQVGSGPAHGWHLPSVIPSQAGASPGVYSSVQGSYGTGPVDTQGSATSTWVAGFQPGSGLGHVVAPQFGSTVGQTMVPHAGSASVHSHQPLLGSGLAENLQSGYHYSDGSVPGWTTVGQPMWAQMASVPASSGVSHHATGHPGPQFPGYALTSTAPGQTLVPHRGSLLGNIVGADGTHVVQWPDYSLGSPETSGVDLGVGYFRQNYRNPWGPNDWPVLSSPLSSVPGELCFCLKDFSSY